MKLARFENFQICGIYVKVPENSQIFHKPSCSTQPVIGKFVKPNRLVFNCSDYRDYTVMCTIFMSFGNLTISTKLFDYMFCFHYFRYQGFMKTFSSDTQHLIVNDGNVCSGSMAIHRVQRKLNLVHEDIFPILKDNGIPTEPNAFDPDVMNGMLDSMKNLDAVINYLKILFNLNKAVLFNAIYTLTHHFLTQLMCFSKTR